eukprot:6192804-Pleurochrysis_carterae.AAC.1
MERQRLVHTPAQHEQTLREKRSHPGTSTKERASKDDRGRCIAPIAVLWQKLCVHGCVYLLPQIVHPRIFRRIQTDEFDNQLVPSRCDVLVDDGSCRALGRLSYSGLWIFTEMCLRLGKFNNRVSCQ